MGIQGLLGIHLSENVWKCEESPKILDLCLLQNRCESRFSQTWGSDPRLPDNGDLSTPPVETLETFLTTPTTQYWNNTSGFNSAQSWPKRTGTCFPVRDLMLWAFRFLHPIVNISIRARNPLWNVVEWSELLFTASGHFLSTGEAIRVLGVGVYCFRNWSSLFSPSAKQHPRPILWPFLIIRGIIVTCWHWHFHYWEDCSSPCHLN